MDSVKAPEKIDKYFSNTLNSIMLLYKNEFYVQSLIVMLSAIDSLALLDAPENETKATGRLFKAWVNKYLLENPGIEYTADDLWAYRCSLLHTGTTESDLSKQGKAKEILFYAGDKYSVKAHDFSTFAFEHVPNKSIAANIEESVLTFSICCQKFARELGAKCESSDQVKSRVIKIVNQFNL